MRIKLMHVFAAALASGAAASAFAQAQYPAQQIRIVCPFPAGGGTDLTARLLGEQMQKLLAQPVVVDNRTGASGMIGTDIVAKAKPDGYTLLVASGEMSLNPHLYPKMAYDWDKELQPITLLVKVANVMAVNMDVPAKSVAELIAYARQNPGKLTFSSSGVGNPQQLTGELFNKMAGVQVLFGTGRPAAAGASEAQCDRGADHEDAGARDEIQKSRLRAVADDAGRIPRADPQRIRQVRAHHCRRGDQTL